MSGIYIKVVPLPESNPNQKPTSFFVVSLFAGITVSAVDEFELDGSRGISNFVMKKVKISNNKTTLSKESMLPLADLKLIDFEYHVINLDYHSQS